MRHSSYPQETVIGVRPGLGPTSQRSSLRLPKELTFSTFLGGSTPSGFPSDEGNGITLDATGSIYVTGVTFSDDFSSTAGAFQTSLAGQSDAFVTKIGASAPTANAGSDQSVSENDNVALDGSGSSPSQHGPLTYGWTQVAGQSVTFDLADPVRPSFVAPYVITVSVSVPHSRNSVAVDDGQSVDSTLP